jgi:hypothetical protein
VCFDGDLKQKEEERRVQDVRMENLAKRILKGSLNVLPPAILIFAKIKIAGGESKTLPASLAGAEKRQN